MRSWPTRSKEAAYLFNPAFCCAVLSATVSNYSQQDNLGMPFPFAFIVLPVILHKQTRNTLPYNTRTSLAAWLEEKPYARIQFYERAISLKSFVREAILFGIVNDWLLIESGRLKSKLVDSKFKNFLQQMDGEARECVLRARLVGKWFAVAGSAETVLSLWEVNP
ncbi:MAG: DUF6521 family protein [Anaerolineales bacterium]|nr:MAG: DUF6521 family protein [Anaerolineales bacterium]